MKSQFSNYGAHQHQITPKVTSKWINPKPGCATSAQQEPLYWLRFGLRSASASFISYYLTIINRLFTNTYKTLFRTVDPKVEGSSPFGLVYGGKSCFYSRQQISTDFKFFIDFSFLVVSRLLFLIESLTQIPGRLNF
jgi:hypothetical protein